VLLFWILFNLCVVSLLALDLGVLRRKSRDIALREALVWSAAWLALACAFAIALFFWQGRTPALQFVTGYVIELSLSADNLFLFLLIFRYFNVPGEHQHKVLFWGILGALFVRGLFIATGVVMLRYFDWIAYAFGALLVYSGLTFLRQGKKEIQPEKTPVLRLFRRAFPVTDEYEDGRFFVRRARLYATPLFIVLLVIETTDIVFAVDSIPAVLAITTNAFIVYTSNVFAILGLRSMYFALAGMMERFRHLHCGAENDCLPLRECSNRMGTGDCSARAGDVDRRVHAEPRKEASGKMTSFPRDQKTLNSELAKRLRHARLLHTL
jgi:tellurite resistance protein TerC